MRRLGPARHKAAHERSRDGHGHVQGAKIGVEINGPGLMPISNRRPQKDITTTDPCIFRPR